MIKVEPPGEGDVLLWERDRLDQGVNVGCAAINGAKQLLTMDLKYPVAGQWLPQPICQSDVFI